MLRALLWEEMYAGSLLIRYPASWFRIEISKDVLYEKYGGEITQEKIESLKADVYKRQGQR